VAGFAMFGSGSFPRGMPQFRRLAFRAGFALCMTFLLLGVFGKRLSHADDQQGCGGRRQAHDARERSRQAHLLCYVAMRAWPPSSTVLELGAPREVYDGLAVPRSAIDTPLDELEAMPDRGFVRLIVGQGRFGVLPQ
jgi:hypothetical protein